MKVIFVNGPCGVGKSTVTKRLFEEMPLSFLFDIDAMMRQISGYNLPENRVRRRNLTVALSESVLKTCMKLGHDVIIDKLVFREELLESQMNIGKKYNAEIIEIILWANRDVVMQRANDRGYHEGGLLTEEKCEKFWEMMNEFKETRPGAKIIDTSELDEDQVFKKVREIVL